jgi:hypothetical protein
MRKVVSADLSELVDVRVDPEAEPADWDQALAKFLLAVVRKRSRSAPGSPAAVRSDTGGSNVEN